tara:strand:+ start:49 stop:234 length:186 start_codon:yes stop_codon:yes gene_type:complete
MPRYRVSATLDVGYEAVVEADTLEEAITLAREDAEQNVEWEKSDDGHHWMVENAWEVNNEH